MIKTIPMVLVTKNKDSDEICQVDLSKLEWKALHIDNIRSFKMEESLHKCSAYPEGIFPGAELQPNGKQLSHIQNFSNYIEFSKVVPEDVQLIQDQQYLTTHFYDQRKIGWGSSQKRLKKGPIIGYCVNGDLYCAADQNQAYSIFYGIVYLSLVKDLPEWIRLRSLYLSGQKMELVGADPEFLNWLAKIISQEA